MLLRGNEISTLCGGGLTLHSYVHLNLPITAQRPVFGPPVEGPPEDGWASVCGGQDVGNQEHGAIVPHNSSYSFGGEGAGDE